MTYEKTGGAYYEFLQMQRMPEHCHGTGGRQPNTADASGEKHVPAVEKKGGTITVKVGELEHPMLEEHYIMWIYLETEQGGYLRKLFPGQKPEAEFVLAAGERPVAAYEYCNLHGLWKAEIK